MIDIKFPELPSSQDKLFTSAENWWNNACLNFFPKGWTIYGIGYKDAADILVEHIAKTKRQQDTLIYPIIFLYRQYLELALKDLILEARKLLDYADPLPKTHRIDDLWRLCDDLLEQISPGDSLEPRENIGRLIEEFAQVDPLSQSFRYPEGKDGKPTLPGLTHINLRNVREVIGKISVLLDGADAMISEYLSHKSEMRP